MADEEAVKQTGNNETDDFDLEGFLPDVAKQFCPQCGVKIVQTGRGRPKKFCSQECSRLWWRNHEKPEHWKSARTVICEYCGKEFLSAKDLYRPRKYCSRSCSNRGKAVKATELKSQMTAELENRKSEEKESGDVE